MTKKINLTSGIGLLVLYLLIIVYFSSNSPYFLTSGNFINILNNAAVLGIISIAMTFVIISGGIDLSVGSIVALTGVITIKLSSQGFNIWISILCGLLTGLIAGFLNGFFITRLKINALITTLGTMSIARGLSFVISGGKTNSILDEKFGVLGRGHLSLFGLSLPVPLILLILLFVMAFFILKYSIFGRVVYAIGGNAEASRLSGIKVPRTQLGIYVLSGLASAVAGLVLSSQLAAAAPQAATGMELSVIAAVILGGCSLNGGKGGIIGTFLGVIILGTVNNGLTILNISSYWQDVARGTVLLIAVGADQLKFMGLTRFMQRWAPIDKKELNP